MDNETIIDVESFVDQFVKIREVLIKNDLFKLAFTEEHQDYYCINNPGGKDAFIEIYENSEMIVTTIKDGICYVRELLWEDIDIMIDLVKQAPDIND